MLPALTVTVFPVPVGIQNLAVPIGKGFTLVYKRQLWLSKSTLLICSEGNAMKDGEN